MIKVYCNGTRIQCLRQGELTVGMAGAPIEFDFSEEWNGLGKTAVFRCDGARDVIVGADGMAVVPHEILTTPGMDVEVGVYAAKEDGTTWPAPTPFCRIGRVKEGADPSGDESYPPTPDVGEQAIAAASTAMQDAAAAQEVATEIQRRADAGEFDGAPGYTPVKGKDYFDGAPGKDGNDYVLTEADKVEIAEIAADLVDVPEGGGSADLTGYATEEWVEKGYQPKGNYLTEVPAGYAKTEDIPTKPSDIGAQPAGNYLTEVPAGYAKTEDIPTKPEDIGAQPAGSYLTAVPAGYATEEYVRNKIAEAELGGEEVDLSGYAQKSELPTKVSQLQNDKGYLTAVPAGYAKTEDIPTKPSDIGAQPAGNYLTAVPDGYAKTEDIPTTPADIGAQPAGNYALISEIPSVPVKSVNGKTGDVSLSASDVGADDSGTASSAVSGHNTNTAAHNDIRLLIEGLTTRINALANSTDEDLDQMAELVAYIKNNKSLIDGITTSKVNVADIVNNLTTNVSNKPLSAAQGVALKSLVDGLQSGKLDASALTAAINTALAQAKASGEFTGATGQRGTGLLAVTTAPSSYTTAVGGITPKYRMALSTIKTQAGVTEVLLGDTVRYSYYHYPVDYLDSSYAYFENRVSIRGASGASVTIESISESTEDGGENVVTFSDDKTLTVRNGKKGDPGNPGDPGQDGHTPVRGKDYYTEADKAEFSEYIASELAKRGQLKPEYANSIEECTDTSKLYVLPDGFIYAYIKTTTTTEGETVPNFTNLMDDPNAYAKKGYRYSHSSAAFKEQASDCAIVVPVQKASQLVVRTRGGSYDGCTYPNSAYLGTDNKTFATTMATAATSWGADENGDTYIHLNPPSSTSYSYLVFHISSNVNLDTLIVTVNEEITYTTTEGGTVTTEKWANTGRAFVPADYEDRIVEAENRLDNAETDIRKLQEDIGNMAISANATTAFSIPAYCPVPQLPADGSEGSDFNNKTVTTQAAYDYMDALASKYTGYITKQTMGKDASGSFDHNRYILTKAYYRAWQRENYPKMIAWKNGSTVIYSVSVSPRVGDNMYSTPYVGTVYKAVTAVNCAAGTLSTRTVNGLVFTRHTDGDVEPTIVYTNVPMTPPGYFATAPVYNSEYSQTTNVSSVGDGYFVGKNGIKYLRYPFEDRKADKTKPLSIFILANEHGLHGDALIPSFVAMRMAKDLCKNTDNPFLKWLKENCIITMIPVGNPWGYARYLVNNSSGYHNSNGVNINRNYDTPGWATSDTNYGDVETFGAYAGSEIETQHIMNTMRLCKPSVGISMHGLGYPDEYRGLTDNGYFIYQGQGFDKARMYKVAETLYSSYNLSRGADTEWATGHYEACGKSPAYIQYVGAVGGLTETICWEAGTENEYTPVAMEQAYTQLLLFLQTWCEEALEKSSN